MEVEREHVSKNEYLPRYIYGPRKPMLGWRHYLIVIWPANGGQRETKTFLSARGAEELARAFRANVYAYGTWEQRLDEYDRGQFPPIRGDVVAEICGQNQAEFAEMVA